MKLLKFLFHGPQSPQKNSEAAEAEPQDQGYKELRGNELSRHGKSSEEQRHTDRSDQDQNAGHEELFFRFVQSHRTTVRYS